MQEDGHYTFVLFSKNMLPQSNHGKTSEKPNWKYLTSTFQKCQGHHIRQRKTEELSQIGGEQGDKVTECTVESSIGYWNKKRMYVQNWVKSESLSIV